MDSDGIIKFIVQLLGGALPFLQPGRLIRDDNEVFWVRLRIHWQGLAQSPLQVPNLHFGPILSIQIHLYASFRGLAHGIRGDEVEGSDLGREFAILRLDPVKFWRVIRINEEGLTCHRDC